MLVLIFVMNVRLPPKASDFRQRRDEPPAFPRLEAKTAVAARRQREQGVGPPPFTDLLGERFKRPQRRRADADRADDRRGHFRLFWTWRLEARKLRGPRRFGLGEPAFQFRHGAVFQRVDANARVELGMGLLNEPALLQLAQMPAHR